MESVPTTLFYSAPLTPGGPEDNWQCDAVTRPPEVICNFLTVGIELGVDDLRTAKDLNPTIDGWGFQKYDFPTKVDQVDFLNYGNASIEAYICETKNFLKETLGADEVVHFDTCIRQKDTERAVKLVDNPFVGPYQRVHVDQNPTSAEARLRHHAGASRQVRRFQIINVWRALVEPVRNFPLALLDYRTVDPSADLIVTRRILPDWMHQRWVQDREGFSLKHREEHRWYHWSGLRPEEVILFKCHDSASKTLITHHASTETEGREASDSSNNSLMDIAGLCPHTAFFDAESPAKGHLRSSADLRFLVLYY